MAQLALGLLLALNSHTKTWDVQTPNSAAYMCASWHLPLSLGHWKQNFTSLAQSCSCIFSFADSLPLVVSLSRIRKVPLGFPNDSSCLSASFRPSLPKYHLEKTSNMVRQMLHRIMRQCHRAQPWRIICIIHGSSSVSKHFCHTVSLLLWWEADVTHCIADVGYLMQEHSALSLSSADAEDACLGSYNKGQALIDRKTWLRGRNRQEEHKNMLLLKSIAFTGVAINYMCDLHSDVSVSNIFLAAQLQNHSRSRYNHFTVAKTSRVPGPFSSLPTAIFISTLFYVSQSAKYKLKYRLQQYLLSCQGIFYAVSSTDRHSTPLSMWVWPHCAASCVQCRHLTCWKLLVDTMCPLQ